MRFLHTADWQLGAQVAHAGDKAPEFRKRRFAAAESVVELVGDENVEFVVIAGDLFEDHNVSDKVVRRAVRLLDELDPLPVFILPGNHDPLRPGGIWDRSSWRAIGDHVRLLDESSSVNAAEDVVLFPCPLTQKKSVEDPTEWIPAREEGKEQFRIGVAHGALSDAVDNPDFPIDPDRPALADLDYLALGDWHGLHVRERLAYPGTIEQSAYDEKNPGNVLLVEIEEPGDSPDLEDRRVGHLRWTHTELDARHVTDVEALEEELSALGEPEGLVVRLEVQLQADADEAVLEAFRALEERLGEDVFHLDARLDDSEYHLTADTELPPGLLTEADEALASILEGEIPEGPAREFAGEDRDVVKEARTVLQRLAREED